MKTHEAYDIAALANHPGWQCVLTHLREQENRLLEQLKNPAGENIERGFLAEWRASVKVREALAKYVSGAERFLVETEAIPPE